MRLTQTVVIACATLAIGTGIATGISTSGGPGNEKQRGSAARDTLRGGGGNDRLTALGGNDRMFGGAGKDKLFGGRGADLMNGGAGNDFLRGQAGNDRANGGAGNDKIFGDAGKDRLTGGRGADRLTGGPGRDVFAGGAGNDTIFARDGVAEPINCGSGRDRVIADRSDRVARNCETVSVPTAPPTASTTLDVPVAEAGLVYTTAQITAPAGAITLRSTNPQAIPHNIALDLDTDVLGPVVSSGGTSEITVTITKPGTYTFYCSIPGHRSAGMVGTLTVT